MAIEPLTADANLNDVKLKINELIGAFNERDTGFSPAALAQLPAPLRRHVERTLQERERRAMRRPPTAPVDS